jgi:hypothetical protein
MAIIAEGTDIRRQRVPQPRDQRVEDNAFHPQKKCLAMPQIPMTKTESGKQERRKRKCQSGTHPIELL